MKKSSKKILLLIICVISLSSSLYTIWRLCSNTYIIITRDTSNIITIFQYLFTSLFTSLLPSILVFLFYSSIYFRKYNRKEKIINYLIKTLIICTILQAISLVINIINLTSIYHIFYVMITIVIPMIMQILLIKNFNKLIKEDSISSHKILFIILTLFTNLLFLFIPFFYNCKEEDIEYKENNIIIQKDEFVSDNKSISDDNMEDIKAYKELLDDGTITQEEFDKKKKELLDL